MSMRSNDRNNDIKNTTYRDMCNELGLYNAARLAGKLSRERKRSSRKQRNELIERISSDEQKYIDFCNDVSDLWTYYNWYLNRKRGDEVNELARQRGDVSAIILNSIINEVASDEVDREAVRRRSESLELSLAGPAPTALASLLARRVVICDLDVSHADAVAIVAGPHAPDADVLDKRRSRAIRRLTGAAKTLLICKVIQGQNVPRSKALRLAQPED